MFSSSGVCGGYTGSLKELELEMVSVSVMFVQLYEETKQCVSDEGHLYLQQWPLYLGVIFGTMNGANVDASRLMHQECETRS